MEKATASHTVDPEFEPRNLHRTKEKTMTNPDPSRPSYLGVGKLVIRLLRTQENAGSRPAAQTIFKQR